MEVDYENLLKDYLMETRELLDLSEQAILDLEKGYSPDRINTLFRSIHTIKGNSAIFDLPSITKLSHTFENLLNHFRKAEVPPSPDAITLFLYCIDVLKEMNSNIAKGKDKDITELLKSIEAFLKNSQSTNGHVTNGTGNGNGKSNGSSKNGHYAKEKIAVPKSFLDKAESEQRYLYLIKYFSEISPNGSEQSPEYDRLSSLGLVLKEGVAPDSSNDNGKSKIVYYSLIISSLNKEQLLDSLPISILSVSLVYPRNGEPKFGFFPKIKEENADQNLGELSRNTENASSESYLKIPLYLLDHMINLTGETIVVRNQLLQKIESYDDPSLLAIVRNLSQLITSSQESVMRTRLQKLETLYKRIPRLIHDLERSTGKEIELILEGGEVELDKNIIDSISDPITHMIRNSVDHGIESPAERRAVGKSPKGRVILSAALRGGNVILKVEDDGRGLNYQRIKEKIIEKGLLSEDEVQRKSEEELSEFIFAPGFSTARAVSSTSGRGVGMDVVKMNFQKAGGTVSIASETGKGTSVIASLPQTLSIINCQMVRAGEMLFAIPQQNISEMLLMDEKLVSNVEKKEVYQLRGTLLPILDVRSIFDLNAGAAQDNKFIVVVHTEKHKFGLIVEEIENPEEIVVKPLSKELAKLNLYTGAAILGDGNVALILDITGITKFLKLLPNIREEIRGGVKKEVSDKQHYLLYSVCSQLFGLDSKNVLRIEQIDPNNIEKVMNREVMQYRGEIIELCRMDQYFRLNRGATEQERTMILFQTTKGKKGILVHEIHNVTEEISAYSQNEDQSSGVVGNGIVSGETVIVVDPITILNLVSKNIMHDQAQVG
ncbi:chemotaxis protein CheA [Leptospira perolatii]|uniref:histidine kinase n=1 Tax=Leptospira perolatii TaxID=2023191 RepID=A0A2M9ZJR9_9LEPT|nr:chemotaxis protein CheW [Leptospira perolatii]PJZ69482.1 chemotaxis protein CheA [Leptospira perolatii]PJZ72307.1 chemotaxis protein CheA [Leptospira perolatii]